MEDQMTIEKTDVFLAKYFVGMNQPLNNKFIISLTAQTPNDSLKGDTEIKIYKTPPINIVNSLKGTFKYVCIAPDSCHILITADGYPKYKYIDESGLERPAKPIFHLRLILADNWKSGIANYDYMDKQGSWHSITDAPVIRI
ncbi:MAG: hypothetical protein C0599_16605 [Salinivirgaceae bacterium]|nr:MAG: hypothetical protein C0599_16605 [Salinivirgaceae bacterium]